VSEVDPNWTWPQLDGKLWKPGGKRRIGPIKAAGARVKGLLPSLVLDGQTQ
jgi:hypothetical protein